MNLNENIKRLRLAKGLNQVEFGKAIGVTKQCVSNWENDNILPSIEMLIRIAAFFSVSTDELLGLKKESVLYVDGLTEKEIAHLRALVEDLKLRG
ncbi:MAG: helix-turn-helix transcriptional regulator [Clostridia bacterium]|nr:helix-turn-helix transcriptional regulator [Clostridia bacterium]